MADEDAHKSDPTPRNREDAKMHATVWEDVWSKCRALSESNPSRFGGLGVFADFSMIVAGEYRSVANGKKLAD